MFLCTFVVNMQMSQNTRRLAYFVCLENCGRRIFWQISSLSSLWWLYLWKDTSKNIQWNIAVRVYSSRTQATWHTDTWTNKTINILPTILCDDLTKDYLSNNKQTTTTTTAIKTKTVTAAITKKTIITINRLISESIQSIF